MIVVGDFDVGRSVIDRPLHRTLRTSPVILTIPCFQEIARIVRIPLPLPLTTRARLGGTQKPNVLPPQRDAKDDSILAARREIQHRRRHAPSQHGSYRSLGKLARSAIFPGKSMVLQRRTRDSNPQPVSRRLISSQVPNHSAILRILAQGQATLSTARV